MIRNVDKYIVDLMHMVCYTIIVNKHLITLRFLNTVLGHFLVTATLFERRKQMNKVILVGRLTRDPEVKYTSGENSMAIARYSLAVDRRRGRNEDAPSADFINIVAFGRDGEFAEKYLRKGMRILVEGRIQTGSYTNNAGTKVYTTDVVVERHEFVESKGNANADAAFTPAAPTAPANEAPTDPGNGFMNIPDGIDEELPFA